MIIDRLMSSEHSEATNSDDWFYFGPYNSNRLNLYSAKICASTASIINYFDRRFD